MKSFDIIVVGGGIAGAGIALDASQRGLRVLLVEKSDFGGEASAGCFGILHGGVRYLQQFDFKRLFESAREQQILRIVAPNHFQPLPIVFPCKGLGMKSNFVLTSAIGFYELIAGFRNCGVGEEIRLPGLKRIRRNELLNSFPGLLRADPTSAVIYSDAQFSSTQRFLLSVIRSAVRAGAEVLNYNVISEIIPVSVNEGVRSSWEVEIRDEATGSSQHVSATFLVNATGHNLESFYSEKLARYFGEKPMEPRRFVKAVQLILPRLFDQGLALESAAKDDGSVISRGGRSFFLIPNGQHTLVGTYEQISESGQSAEITEVEINEFINELVTAYDFTEKPKVLAAWGGYIPLDWVREDRSYSVSRDDLIVEHYAADGSSSTLPRALSVAAVKYSTFRKTAERVVDKICNDSFKSAGASISKQVPLFGSEVESFDLFKEKYREILMRFNADAFPEYLYRSYGSAISELAKLKAELDCESFIELETEYFRRYEFARNSEDVLRRRLPFSRSVAMSSEDKTKIEGAFGAVK